MKTIIISVIIGLVAIGVIISFTNTENQSVEKIDEITSDTTLNNPIQKYQVNTKCELIYIHLGSVERDDSPWPVNEEQVRELQDEIIKDATEKTARIDHENTKQEELEKIGLELSEEAENKIVGYIIEYNSINPKFKEIVKNLKLTNPEEVLDFYNLTTEDYTEDPKCGKILHDEFADKLYDFQKIVNGQEIADAKQKAIISALYG